MKLLITEQQYIKLSESKDYVEGIYNGNTIEASNEDWDAVPFVYFNNKVYVGYCPELGIEYKEDGYVDDNGENDYSNLHSDIIGFYKFVYRNDPNFQLELPKRRNTYDFLGRIWFDREVLSFWKYPQDINTLKNVLSLLHKEMETIYDININFEDYIVDMNKDPYNNYLISLKDYVKGNDATEDEMEQPHLLPAKEKRNAPQMKAVRDYDNEMKSEKFKNVPEYKWNFEKTKNMAEEKNKQNQLIKEDPDSVYNGFLNNLFYDDWDALSFGIYNYNMYIGYNKGMWNRLNDMTIMKNISRPGIHSNIYRFYKYLTKLKLTNKPVTKIFSTDDFTFSGRIWMFSKTISFWTTPPPNKIMEVINLIKKELINIYDYNLKTDDINIEIDNKLIPLKEYIKQDKTPDKIEPKIHLLPSEQKRNTPQMKAVRDYDNEMKSVKFKNVPEYKWNFEKTKNLAEDETQQPKNTVVNKNKEHFFIENNINPDNLSFIGKGDFGTAYSIGDGRVLKITNSKQEFEIAKQLENNDAKVLESFAKIFKTEIVDNNMMIILEELYEDSNIENLFYQLEEILNEQGLPIQYLFMLDYDLLDLDDDMIKFIDQIDDINRAYRYIGIEASDMKPDNFGYDRNGILKAFDIDDKNKK